MRCSWCDRLGFASSFTTFLTFLDVSVSTAMGCFIGCFRIRDPDDDADRRRRRRPRPVNSREAILSQNRLSALFLTEGEDGSPSNDGGKANSGSPQINKELREEAKFLKACGTIAETPAEIRKTSQKFKTSPIHSSISKLQLDQRPDEPPTPIKISEEFQHGTVSSEHTPSSCISSVQNTGGVSNGDADEAGDVTSTPWPSARKVNQSKNKSVRFECDSDGSSSKSSSDRASQNSPYPTPLKLSEEMQTPGTAFASNIEDVANGKAKIRSQYVYSISNPVENVSQEESIEQLENETPKPKARVEEDGPSIKELKLDATLSSWLKPVEDTETVSRKNPPFGRTPGDRPIIGMVAAHWNEEDNAHVSPKWWDGNGIPNSTNKYKEDQKVSWHATPFEERLEKALSEESALPQRNLISGKPITFDENEESDTALSQFQSSTHSKSVVSF